MITYFVKTLYSKTWKSEYNLQKYCFGYLLIPSENTSFEIKTLSSFREEAYGKFVFRLENPKNINHTLDEVCDVIKYNGVLCYVFKNTDNNYQLQHAIGGSVIEMDSYYNDIGSYRKYDFELINCQCGNNFYYNTSKIPLSEIYEVTC